MGPCSWQKMQLYRTVASFILNEHCPSPVSSISLPTVVTLERFNGKRPGHAQTLFVLDRLVVKRLFRARLVVGDAAKGDVRDFLVYESLAEVAVRSAARVGSLAIVLPPEVSGRLCGGSWKKGHKSWPAAGACTTSVRQQTDRTVKPKANLAAFWDGKKEWIRGRAPQKSAAQPPATTPPLCWSISASPTTSPCARIPHFPRRSASEGVVSYPHEIRRVQSQSHLDPQAKFARAKIRAEARKQFYPGTINRPLSDRQGAGFTSQHSTNHVSLRSLPKALMAFEPHLETSQRNAHRRVIRTRGDVIPGSRKLGFQRPGHDRSSNQTAMLCQSPSA